ncbi:epoxide hydrolase 4 isoform X2 [Lepeophtheirus salmonis]|uniref:epoxide hydrolase 4 isoform X2 n=1 Tax=Lepeophtheirus salmonis TaxID=72036 RepID=UPI001AE241FE|nr:epoxide hydrolase 4-like isoform X2 [Lepeophtheirus salmonis]
MSSLLARLVFRILHFVDNIWAQIGFTFLGDNKELRNMHPPHALYEDPSLGKHRYLKAGGNKYHYIESGSSKNALLLCLHDFGDFWYGFRHQLAELKSNVWVVVPDLKGFGDSDKPSQVNEYRMEVIVMEILQLILGLKKEKCYILANGLGSYIAWHFVSAFPNMIEGFISIDGPHPKALCSNISRSWSYLKKYRWLYMYQLPYVPEFELTLMGNTQYNEDDRSSKDIEAYDFTFSRQSDWIGGLNYYRNFPLHLCHLRYNEERKSTPLPIKVMFIAGDDRNKVDFELICRSSEFVDKFTVQIVENSGQKPHQTHSKRVNAYIKQFLDISNDNLSNDYNIESSKELELNYGAPRLLNSIFNKILDLTFQKDEPKPTNELSHYNAPPSIPCKF